MLPMDTAEIKPSSVTRPSWDREFQQLCVGFTVETTARVRLGAAISNSEGRHWHSFTWEVIRPSTDFLITESLLALLARLLATENSISGRSERTKFVQEALGSSKFFKCSRELVAILQEASTSDWDVAATRLIDALSESDIK